jgi:hypothetical protein
MYPVPVAVAVAAGRDYIIIDGTHTAHGQGWFNYSLVGIPYFISFMDHTHP